MKGGLRQSNSWLHGWAGLLLGWMMFAIFLTGTIAFFRQEVTFWMQPELHRATAVSPEQAATVGLERLGAIAPEAREWTINLPSERNPTMRISWESGRENERGVAERGGAGSRGESSAGQPGARDEQHSGEGHSGEDLAQAEMSAQAGTPEAMLRAGAEEAARRANARGGRPRDPGVTLDPATGEVLSPRETAGGEFLYNFHYRLHAMPREWGRWIVGLATFAMFVAILSGIITHKKIFRDFFTFRRAKGQRSWLDGHNAMAVLSLPFHLMITFSGLLLLGGTLLPWADLGRDGGHGQNDGRGAAAEQRIGNAPGPQTMLAPDVLLTKAEALWGAPAGRMTITRPDGQAEKVELSIQKNDSLLLRPGGGPGRTLEFDARSGELLEREDSLAENALTGIDRTMSALHLGRFAPWGLRWLLFAAGVMGTVMIATGLVLWSVKRAEKRRGAPGNFGHRLVDALNVATIAGLPLAIGAYFWANRLLPATSLQRVDHEIIVFFGAWLGALVHALLRQGRAAWLEQVAAGGILFAALPIVNPLTGGAGLTAAVMAGNWLVAGFDLVALLTGTTLLYIFFRLLRRQGRVQNPVRTRLAQPLLNPAE